MESEDLTYGPSLVIGQKTLGKSPKLFPFLICEMGRETNTSKCGFFQAQTQKGKEQENLFVHRGKLLVHCEVFYQESVVRPSIKHQALRPARHSALGMRSDGFGVPAMP